MFIAKRAVCFDRWYEIGEEIPSHVIDPRQVRRILSTGFVVLEEREEIPPVEDSRKKKKKKKKREVLV